MDSHHGGRPILLIYCDFSANFLFRGFDGTRRNIPVGQAWQDPVYPPTGTCSSSGGAGKGPHGWAAAGSEVAINGNNAPLTVIDPSGTVYKFPAPFVNTGCYGCSYPYGVSAQTITDRNGNQISLTSNAYSDTLGRQVVSWSGLGHDGDTVTVAGIAGNIVMRWGTTTMTFPETGNSAPGTDPANKCTMIAGYTPPQSIPFLNEIDLPNNTKYTFTPDGTYGRIGQINFPTGGFVRYVWGPNPSSAVAGAITPISSGTVDACSIVYDAPAITERIVNDGTRNVLDQHFQYNTQWPPTLSPPDGQHPWGNYPWTSKATTVTTTDLVTGQSTVTIYTYGSMPGDLAGC